MREQVEKNSAILKYITRAKTLLVKARNLIAQAFIQPYLQMMYAVWPMLSISSIEKIEAKNRQLSRLIHNWWDATNDEVRWLPNYQAAESKAQRCLQRFIDKAEKISPELFEDYILGKTMLLWTINDNASWLVCRPCSISNTRTAKKKELGRDCKLGFLVEFPVIIIFDQIKALAHT